MKKSKKASKNKNDGEQVVSDTSSKQQDSSEDVFKIATVNLNSISSAFRKGFSQYVSNIQSDIFCVQETKLHENSAKGVDNYIIDGYESYFINCEQKKGYSGIGIYTKIKPISVRHGFDEPEGRIMVMEFDKFYLVNVYGPNIGMKFDKGDYISNVWGPKIVDLMTNLSKTKTVILCGDLNIGTSHLDVYDMNLYNKIMSKVKEMNNWLIDLLHNGFSDVFRSLYPEKQQFTYFSSRSKMKEKGKGLRLDYFIMPSSLVNSENKLVLDCMILNGDFSDHVPSILYLKKNEILTNKDKKIDETKSFIVKD